MVGVGRLHGRNINVNNFSVNFDMQGTISFLVLDDGLFVGIFTLKPDFGTGSKGVKPNSVTVCKIIILL